MWPVSHPDGGLVVLATSRGRGAHVTVSATMAGRGRTGGHGHDDAGSYEYWSGEPIVVDRGTGSYTGDVLLRELHRSVLSHSVVQVDGRDQNPPVPGKPFRRIDRALPHVTSFDGSGGGTVELGHSGYLVAPGRVSAWRRLHLREDGTLEVDDELRGAGAHDVALRVQWAPGLAVLPAPAIGETRVLEARRDGRLVARLTVEARDAAGHARPLDVTCVPARHSWRQGAEEAAVTTVLAVRGGLPLRLRHVLSTGGT